MPNVICQKWEESERGWGCRPDGFSLHLTEDDRASFVYAHWETLPDSVPDEYSRPSGTPFECPVTDALFERIKAAKNGVYGWTLHNEGLIASATAYPWPGGNDGWTMKDPPRFDVEKS